jgi:hypothetical protein
MIRTRMPTLGGLTLLALTLTACYGGFRSGSVAVNSSPSVEAVRKLATRFGEVAHDYDLECRTQGNLTPSDQGAEAIHCKGWFGTYSMTANFVIFKNSVMVEVLHSYSKTLSRPERSARFLDTVYEAFRSIVPPETVRGPEFFE